MNKENLLTLAGYLESLPEDYQHFGMRWFTEHFGERETEYALKNGGLDTYGCGTVACAVGHGPAAGFLFPADLLISDKVWDSTTGVWKNIETPDWSGYCQRFFLDVGNDDGVTSAGFEWCFGSGWVYVDNTHWGAAARIRYFVANGVPEGFDSDVDIDDDCVVLYESFRKCA